MTSLIVEIRYCFYFCFCFVLFLFCFCFGAQPVLFSTFVSFLVFQQGKVGRDLAKDYGRSKVLEVLHDPNSLHKNIKVIFCFVFVFVFV